MMKTCCGNPTKIQRICEWTKKPFDVDWKHRNQRFIDKRAMYEWRKSQNREMVKCLTCNSVFERYKTILHPKTGKPTQYCSNECNRKSNEKKDKLRIWGASEKNHWNNSDCQKKARHTKLMLYGNETYSDINKMRATNMMKDGVPYAVYLPQSKSNGKRVSGFQKRIFVEIKQKHPDAELEKYLPDVQKAVDIYIPSLKKVIECHGDYWHCNPTKCSPNYYNRLVHLTAKEIWERDNQKKEILKRNGYEVEIIWENANKQFKHIEC
jgi:hypothetical protein